MFDPEFQNLKDLMIHELKDVYDAEHRILEALPKMAKAASDQELSRAFKNHHAETESHVTRLESVFSMLDLKPERETCQAMKGLIKEGEECLSAKGDPVIRDHALIASAQRVEHYEMAAYGALRTIANAAGETKAAELLQETLDEEGGADKLLTTIAENLYRKAA